LLEFYSFFEIISQFENSSNNDSSPVNPVNATGVDLEHIERFFKKIKKVFAIPYMHLFMAISHPLNTDNQFIGRKSQKIGFTGI